MPPPGHEKISIEESMTLGGGRHYRGVTLGRLNGWSCPACGALNAGGDLSAGCASCHAGSERAFVPRTPQRTLEDLEHGEVPGPGMGQAEPAPTAPAQRQKKEPAPVSYRSSLGPPRSPAKPGPRAAGAGSNAQLPLVDYNRIDQIIADRLLETMAEFRTTVVVAQLEMLLADVTWRRAVAEGLVQVRVALERGVGDPAHFPDPAALQTIADVLMADDMQEDEEAQPGIPPEHVYTHPQPDEEEPAS